MLPNIYCIVDCETTGTSSAKNRIIEICIHRFEQNRLVDQFQSLINPGCSLPEFIVGLTGIQPAMLTHAPRFAEVADRILEMLAGATMIAHNARFDRSFIQRELQRVDKPANFPILCTVALSRKLFPKEKKHNLDSVAQRIGHVFSGRHRAEGDVLALANFIKYGQENFKEKFNQAVIESMQNNVIPAQIKKESLDALPSIQGLYYFLDKTGKCIYIGRSKNIKERVMAHLSQDLNSRKSILLKKEIAHVEFNEIKSGLALEVLEVFEIQRFKPRFNRQYIRFREGYKMSLQPNKNGYLVPHFESLSGAFAPSTIFYGPFKSKKIGNSLLMTLGQLHNLCPSLLTKKAAKGACFQYHLKRCRGACCNKEPAELYNLRLISALDDYKLQSYDYDAPVLLDDEVSMLNWNVVGFKSINYRLEDDAFNYDIYQVLKKYMKKTGAKINKMPYNESGVA